MLDSFTNDPPIFRHLIFPSFDWKDLIASKWKFTLASENKLPVWLDVAHAGSTCWLDKVFEFSVGQLEDLLNRQAACLAQIDDALDGGLGNAGYPMDSVKRDALSMAAQHFSSGI